MTRPNADIERRAADWLARRFGGLTVAEERDLAGWLAADPRHAGAFRELEATWSMLDGVRSAGGAGPPDPDALAPRRRRMTWLVPLAAAAALALALLQFRERPSDHDFGRTFVAAGGEYQRAGLPDGSVIRLNADTEVRVRYTADERRVELLRGEAHFTVAKNPARPFLVAARGVAVRAVGTAFNVRLAGAGVEVLVTEGRVRVEDGRSGASVLAARPEEPGPLLRPGERALVPVPVAPSAAEAPPPPPVAAVRVPDHELQQALAWHERRLDFVAAPLADIVRQFNARNHLQLRVDDPALAARRFGGSFRADEPEGFVQMLEGRFGVRVERRGDEILLRGGR